MCREYFGTISFFFKMFLKSSRFLTLSNQSKRSFISKPTSIFGSNSSSSSPSTSSTPIRKHNERILFKYPQELVYEVIKDVDSYKHFLPWCIDSKLYPKSITPTSDSNIKEMKGELVIGFQMFKEKYTSNLFLEEPNKILIKASELSVFKLLNSEFQLKSASNKNHTWVNFYIEFQFQNQLYSEIISDLFFNEVAKKMIRCFDDRCKYVSEKRSKKI